jgi:hypothetical protein
MSQSAVGRTLSQPPFKKYLMGWVAAIIQANVQGNNVFYIEDEKNREQNKVFSTQSIAEDAIKRLYPDACLKDGSKIAVRKYLYLTNIPEHAKGLREWTKDDSINWIFL